MAQVYLSLGSNINRAQYIRAALDALAGRFGELQVSRIFESEAVGFQGDNFYNLVVGLQTDLPVGQLALCLRGIEDANGRLRSGPKFSARTLDIDILTYDHLTGTVDGVKLPRGEIVKMPLFYSLWQRLHLKYCIRSSRKLTVSCGMSTTRLHKNCGR